MVGYKVSFFIRVVAGKGHCPIEKQWRGGPTSLGRFWVRSKHALNPTHGDADGWPPGSANSWVWGKLLAETPAVCEGVTFAIPGQRVLVGEP